MLSPVKKYWAFAQLRIFGVGCSRNSAKAPPPCPPGCFVHPSGASDNDFEAVLGPAQFKLRPPEAMLRLPKLPEHETLET
eukprot:1145019-Alexandrium_andersonii.AAC.1